MKAKQALRIQARAAREAMPKGQRLAASSAIVDALVTMFRNRKVTRVAVFYPMRGELDVRALKAHFTVYLPKISGGRIAFYKDDGNHVEGPFGTTVPAHDEATDLADIEAVVVPGLCYDKAGYRIGYGKGYYDELLSRYQGFSVGVCYADLVFDNIPKKPHDRAVDTLLTERGVVKG